MKTSNEALCQVAAAVVLHTRDEKNLLYNAKVSDDEHLLQIWFVVWQMQ